MSGIAALYGAFMRTALAGELQYRTSALIWLLGMILEPLVFLVVWSVVAEGAGGRVGAHDAGDFAAYYVAMMLVNHLTFSWIMEVFQYRIQYGQLSFELLRPVHPIHADVAENVAYKLFTLSVIAPAAVSIALAFGARFPFVVWSIGAALLSLPLAFAVRFCLDWTLALTAFWTVRVAAVNRVYYTLVMFLSGRFAPIDVLPAPLDRIAEALPFYYVLAFPVELLLGRVTPEAAARGFGWLSLWLAFAIGLLSIVWRRAVRRHAAVGA